MPEEMNDNGRPLLKNSKIFRTSQGSDEDLPNSLKPKPKDLSSADKSVGTLRPRKSNISQFFSSLAIPWHRRSPKVTTAAFSDNEAQFSLPARRRPCRITFIFDPAGKFCYYWSMFVSVAFLYNLWVISYRFAFQEITKDTVTMWFSLDYTADFIYLLDLLMGFRTGFLNEDGVLQTNARQIRLHYVNTSSFYLSCLSLLPIDFLYLSIEFRSIVRCIRLVKVYKFLSFLDITERHTNHPSLCRSIVVLHNLLLVFHWNACLIYLATKSQDPSKNWLKVPEGSWNSSDMLYIYFKAHYLNFGLLLPTAQSEVTESRTQSRIGIFILVVDQIFGLLLFAAVIGYVVNIVSLLSYSRKQFQGEVGTEMYIVNRGKLYVISDDGKTVLATLKAGCYFGEISLLNLGTEGNRRTASVISVGYSDLFCLSKKDIWEVLEDYPAARDRLEQIAHRRLLEKNLQSGKQNCFSVSSPDSEDRRYSAPASFVDRVFRETARTPMTRSVSPYLHGDPRTIKVPRNTRSLPFVQTTEESYI